jgi:hypothetical protein
MPIEADSEDAVARGQLPGGDDGASAGALGPGKAILSAEDYCHLAEECFVLAAVTKDPGAVAELLKAGDDYLRRAAGWRADRSRSDPK